jgi:protein-disulfide isomerase
MKKLHYWVLVIILLLGVTCYFISIKNNSEEIVLKDIYQIGENDIILGDYHAVNTMIVFFDYNCTYCKKFANETLPLLENELMKNNKLKIILKLVCKPTDKLALKAYQTAICINRFGDFQKLHKLLLHKGEIIYTEHFNQLIHDYISMNEDVAECIMNSDFKDVKKNIYQLQQINSKGTPTFIIGKRIIKGFKSYDELNEILDSEYSFN